MSGVFGVVELNDKLKSFDEYFVEHMNRNIGDEMLALQKEAAELVPVDEGIGRATLLLPEAIRVTDGKAGRNKTWTFGFITAGMKKAAFYLFWVEFGTKAYEKGESRSAGTTKSGRRRFQRLKRRVPARRALPFFRPAVANFLLRMRQQRNVARIFASAAAAAGLNAKVRD